MNKIGKDIIAWFDRVCVDIWFRSYNKAKVFGRRRLKISYFVKR